MFWLNIFLSIFCFFNFSQAEASVDPFSKITITSTKAICQKNNQDPNTFIFQYEGNVRVTFADQTKVTSDFLEVVFDDPTKKKNTSARKKVVTENKLPKESFKNFKSIVFKDRVSIVSSHRKALADRAEFFLTEQRCVLVGNVKIWQTKEKPRDIPIAIQSQKAELSLFKEELSFIGSSQQPVSTTIVLEGHPSLDFANKAKNKKLKRLRKKKIKNG